MPILLACYWLCGSRSRNLLLLGASLFFYTWGEGWYVLLLLISIVVNYTLGVFVDKQREQANGRRFVWLAVIFNLGILIWCKYDVFFVGSLNQFLSQFTVDLFPAQSRYLPLGISFFTFQALAYILDVYRGNVAAHLSLPRFALFMAMFPKIAAGPIIRYSEVADDMPERMFDKELFSSGVKRFVIGLGKKVLIADTIAKTADQVFAIPAPELTTGIAWLGIACYTLQIYFDFSGYSDMAIGLGRMLGFRIRENFNYPYMARSLTDFWRRWHISLSTWFRDYLYIPLSYALMTDNIRQKIVAGKYKTNYRNLFSIIVVFVLCGLWHGVGWTFVVWGLLHGLVLCLESLWLEKTVKKLWVPLQHVYLLLVVMLSWVLFRTASIMDATAYYKALLGFTPTASGQYRLALFMDNELLLTLAVGIICTTSISQNIACFLEAEWLQKYASLLEIAVFILILLSSFAVLASSTFSPFIYQQF